MNILTCPPGVFEYSLLSFQHINSGKYLGTLNAITPPGFRTLTSSLTDSFGESTCSRTSLQITASREESLRGISSILPSPKAQDFKIRFALRNTDYWGSYMTDIIKNFEEKKSNKMMDVLNEDKNLENKNIEIFLEEIESLGVPNKKIIAFGSDTYKILERNLKDKYNLVKVTHYSHFISKENYRYELAKI